MEKKRSYIFACFTRKLDIYHKSNNRIHLIGSTIGYFDTCEAIDNYILNFNHFGIIKYVFLVGSSNEWLVPLDGKMKIPEQMSILAKCGKRYIIEVSIETLVGLCNNNNNNNNNNTKNKYILIETIFGKYDLIEKDFNAFYSNSLFIFVNSSWSNILYYFNISGIDISSGDISKRHIINNIQIQLINFVNDIYPKGLRNDILYQVGNSNLLKKKIPDSLNLKYLEKYKEAIINNMRLEDYCIDEKKYMNMAIQNTTDSCIIYTIKLIILFIKKNYEKAIGSYKNSIEDLKKENLNIIKKIEESKSSINSPNCYLTNKQQTKQKELNLIINSRTKEVCELEKLLIFNNDKIENLQKGLNLWEKAWAIFWDNCENIEFNNLNKINDFFIKRKVLDPKMGHKFSLKIKLNSTKSKRAYSTYSFRYLRVKKFNDLSHTNLIITKNIKYYSNLLNKNHSLQTSVENNLIKFISVNEDKSLNVFTRFYEKIIKNDKLNSLEKQTNIEENWIEHIKNKLESLDNKTRKSLSYVIKMADETLNLKLQNKKTKNRFVDYYHKLNKKHLIITYNIMINYYDKLGFTYISIKIGNDILYDIYSKKWLEYVKNEKYINFNDYLVKIGINKVQILKLGAFFIEIFCSKPTAIFEKTFKVDQLYEDNNANDNILSVLELNEEYFNFIKQNFIFSPVSLPMLTKPNIWSETTFGGYLTNKEMKQDLITGSNFNKHNMENRQQLYTAVNKLNLAEFKINTILLNYLDNEGSYILGHYYNKLLKDKTDRDQSLKTLIIANSLSKLNKPFFISTSADWRGRIYTNSFYISYQGSDLSNALLNFYHGEELTESGKYYLYIYGANCYDDNNLSKKSFYDRYKWVENNYELIVNLNKEFLLKAKNLFLFTSFCLVLKELANNPKFKVHMPIFLDATCSGIQHLAALIKDLKSAVKVNLTPQSDKDEVGDIYSYLIEPINKAINSFGENNLEFSNFKSINLSRKQLKLPIMTKTYSVSVVGIANQLRNSFDKILENNKIIYYLVPTYFGFTKLTHFETFRLAEIINKQIYLSIPSLEPVYDYFKNIVKLCLTLNIPLTWITPSGLKITQFYALSIQNKVSISFKNKTKNVVLREVTDKVDSRKQVNSIIPNIIHSLDASHLINILNTGLNNVENSNILTVHDCFGSHPNNIEQLKNLVISEFVKLYSNKNFLKTYHERIIQSLTDNKYIIYTDKDGKLYIQLKRTKIYIPDLPQPGELEYNKILLSKYLIS